MSVGDSVVTFGARTLARLLIGFFFNRIEYFHRERVPDTGPILFASNHPASMTDALILGTAVRRKIHFVAAAPFFRLRPVAWLLRHCGVIPVNRVRDDPNWRERESSMP